jgi:hypothetical protein
MMIEYGKSQGLTKIIGQILHENSVMVKMCRELGFEVKTNPEDLGVYDVTLVLDRPLTDGTAPWLSRQVRPAANSRHSAGALLPWAIGF